MLPQNLRPLITFHFVAGIQVVNFTVRSVPRVQLDAIEILALLVQILVLSDEAAAQWIAIRVLRAARCALDATTRDQALKRS